MSIWTWYQPGYGGSSVSPGLVAPAASRARSSAATMRVGALRVRQAVIDRRRVADGDDVTFVELVVLDPVGLQVHVDAIEAAPGLVLPQHPIRRGPKLERRILPSRAVLLAASGGIESRQSAQRGVADGLVVDRHRPLVAILHVGRLRCPTPT